MANLLVKDGAAASKYLKSSGAGTDLDPHIPQHLETNSAAILAALADIGSETTLDAVVTALTNLLTELQAKTEPANTQAISAASLPLPSGAATEATLATIDGRVDGLETLVTSTNTKLDTVNTNLTTIDGRVDAVETKLDSIITNTAAATPAGTNNIGATTDAGPAWATVYGVAGARFTSADASGADAAVTDAPTGGQKLVITDIILSVDTAMRVDFKLETAGTVLFSIYMAANSAGQITLRSKFKLATADKKLMVRTSVAGNVAVTAAYYSEA